MTHSSSLGWAIKVALVAILCGGSSFAQFSSGVRGVLQDPSGASIAKATVTLLNTTTQVSYSTTSNESGGYQFVSLPPGPYSISAAASGFATRKIDFALQTDQTLNVPISLTLATQAENVLVTTEAPVLNTDETRNELTLTTRAVETLPLSGRNLINLVTLAPGVTGLGTTAGGSPGSAVDNFSTELQVDASANGRGSVGNMYIVDGLDVTSFIRPGVLNLVPNPDAVQETSIQTNTFSVEYGRASAIQMAMTTKSGTDTYHGLVSDYFTTEQLWAGTEFIQKYHPFHTNNMSATFGGPIIPKHQFFGFFAIEPLRQSTSGGSLVTVEDPAFTTWAQQNFPNTVGTKLLTTYRPTAASINGVSQTAAQAFPGTCGTSGTGNMPCSLPVFDNALFSSSNYRHAYQYDFRIDKYFNKDRLYGTYFKGNLDTGGPSARPAFDTTSVYHTKSVQINESHTFSPTMVNEAIFGYLSIEGISPQTGNFSVPVVSVSGLGVGFGDGFAQGDFIQHSYHWRDVLHHVHGSHSFDFGYEGWYGQDIVYFQGPYSQPNFSFNNIFDLVQDAPHSEGSLAYDPLTGKPAPGNYFFVETTGGAFVQDKWKVNKNLTLNYGLRWDDFGNPQPIMGQVLSDFHLGAGSTYQQQVANGFYQQAKQEFNHSITAWSPRFGVAWDITGRGSWVARGGFGVYHDWLTLGNAENNLKGNPPGWIAPNFFAGTATLPVFAFGTSNHYPFGFPVPALPPGTLDTHGGLVGAQLSVGGNDENMKPENSYVYTATLERSLAKDFVASVGYMGQKSTDLVTGSSQTTVTSYGVDINRFNGDLIQCNCFVPSRLNPSFGAISFATNGAESSYNAFYAALRGRFGSRGYFNASYTRSRSYDDGGIANGPYPTATNFDQYRGPSQWDAPNRLSLSWSYELPGNSASGFMKEVVGGWTFSGTTILQSGTPFTVYTTAPFQALTDSSGRFIGFAPGSGDFNADGDNFDYPNVSSYSMPNSRRAYLNGVVNVANFPFPNFGTEGNEKVGRFRNQGFAEVNAALLKNVPITERLRVQFRFEAFNLLNRVNLAGVDPDMADGTFGKSTSQLEPRWLQIGARVIF
jgi:Carboxypeptidase regulatory-like domain/TonB dependent receptor